MRLTLLLPALAALCASTIAHSHRFKRHSITPAPTAAFATASASATKASSKGGRALLPVATSHPARSAARRANGFTNLTHSYSSNAHYAATVNFITKLPALVAADYPEIVSLTSSSAGVDIVFASKRALRLAQKNWPMPMVIVVEGGQGGCSNDTRYHPVDVRRILSSDEANLTLKVWAFCSTWKIEASFHTVSIGYKDPTSALARRSQTIPSYDISADFNYDSIATSVGSQSFDVTLDCIDCYASADVTVVIETGSKIGDSSLHIISAVSSFISAGISDVKSALSEVETVAKLEVQAVEAKLTTFLQAAAIPGLETAWNDAVIAYDEVVKIVEEVYGEYEAVKEKVEEVGTGALDCVKAFFSGGSCVAAFEAAEASASASLASASASSVRAAASKASVSAALASASASVTTLQQALSSDDSAISAHTSAVASFKANGSYIGVVGSVKANIDLSFAAQGDLENPFYKSLWTGVIAGIEIPDVIDLGIYLKLIGSGNYELSGNLTYSSGFDFELEDFNAVLPISESNVSSSATFSDYSFNRHTPDFNVQEAKLKLDAYFEPQLLLGGELLLSDDDSALSVGVGVKVGILNEFQIANSTCNDGIMQNTELSGDIRALFYDLGILDGSSDSDDSSDASDDSGSDDSYDSYSDALDASQTSTTTKPKAYSLAKPAGLNKNLYEHCWDLSTLLCRAGWVFSGKNLDCYNPNEAKKHSHVSSSTKAVVFGKTSVAPAATATTSTTSTVCKSGTYLLNKSCVTSCPTTNYYANPVQNICQACSSIAANSITCTSEPYTSEALSCDSTSWIFVNSDSVQSCVKSCPAGTTANGPFGPIGSTSTIGFASTPPSPAATRSPTPQAQLFRDHPDIRINKAGQRVIGSPPPPPPPLQRHTLRLNSATFRPLKEAEEGAALDNTVWASREEGEPLEAYFAGEWGGVKTVDAADEDSLVIFRSFWLTDIQVKVDRWLDREGSKVTISFDFKPLLDKVRPLSPHHLTLDFDMNELSGFDVNKFEILKNRLRRWQVSEGDREDQKRHGPCTCFVSQYHALVIPLLGKTLAVWGPPPPGFDPKDPRTWVPKPPKVLPKPNGESDTNCGKKNGQVDDDNEKVQDGNVEDMAEETRENGRGRILFKEDKGKGKRTKEVGEESDSDEPLLKRQRRRSSTTSNPNVSRSEFDRLLLDLAAQKTAQETTKADLKALLDKVRQLELGREADLRANARNEQLEMEVASLRKENGRLMEQVGTLKTTEKADEKRLGARIEALEMVVMSVRGDKTTEEKVLRVEGEG
ncbi:hypothetical protein P7C70_g6941, partial [Phenoliferia sp. Uapishka_3]